MGRLVGCEARLGAGRKEEKKQPFMLKSDRRYLKAKYLTNASGHQHEQHCDQRERTSKARELAK